MKAIIRTALLASIVLTPAVVVPVASAAQAQTASRNYSIAAQDLGDALRQFAKQSGRDVVFDPALTQGKSSKPIQGKMSAEGALQALLRGSGLSFTATSAGFAIKGNGSEPADATETTSLGDASFGGGAAAGYAEGRDSEAIVVTGTLVRGVAPVGSKVVTIGREDIEKSGYGRIEEILAKVPQNFPGLDETGIFSPNSSANNFNRGSQVQLRGLGLGTTLSLINGQRLPLGALGGEFSDISVVPTSAVERIEILTDGASALYGSDAIGGVVNIILRKDFSGLETRFRFSTADGDANEYQSSILAGTSGDGYRFLIGYQYNLRDNLAASERVIPAANGDLTRFGGGDYRVRGGNPGTITIDGVRYAIPEGQDGTNLTLSDLSPDTQNISDQVTFTDILPRQRLHSVFVNAGLDLSEGWEFEINGRYSNRRFVTTAPQAGVNFFGDFFVPATNAFNNFGQDVEVAYDFTNELGPIEQFGSNESYAVFAGVTGQLSDSWKVRAFGGRSIEKSKYKAKNQIDFDDLTFFLSSSDPDVALNVFGDHVTNNAATLDSISDGLFDSNGTSRNDDVTIVADGKLFELPAGSLRGAIGGGYRSDRFERTFNGVTDPIYKRHSFSAFGELVAPLLAPGSASWGVGSLDLSLAARYERYDDFGASVDPKVGVRWAPLRFLQFRGTWGKSFKAPPLRLSQGGTGTSRVRQVADHQSPTGRSLVLQRVGTVDDLGPEKGTAWTAGFDILPSGRGGFSGSATFFDIRYDNRVGSPGSSSQFLSTPEREALFPDLIDRNPSSADIDAICSSPSHDGSSCAGPIAAIVDARVRNLSIVKTRGIDFDASYAFTNGLGDWRVSVAGTYAFYLNQKTTETSPVIRLINTLYNPVDLRLSGDISWSKDAFDGQFRVNYVDDYHVSKDPSSDQIDSWTTFDLSLGYRPVSGPLNGMELRLSGTNLLDKRPPFVDQFEGAFGTYGYDSSNANILGRRVSIQILKRW